MLQARLVNPGITSLSGMVPASDRMNILIGNNGSQCPLALSNISFNWAEMVSSFVDKESQLVITLILL